MDAVERADTEPVYRFAVWYYQDGALCYELYETEEEAAAGAVYISDDASLIGLQKDDGTTVAEASWSAYIKAREKRWEEWNNRKRLPAVPMRQARNPFHPSEIAIVEASEPAWLGLPMEAD
jgi:hypothetical protein